jgi:CRP-like cAMP-binding protein
MSQISQAKCFKFKKNHALYKENDPVKGLSIFYIKKGKVQLKYALNNNKTLAINVPQGGLFGLFEALNDNPSRITSAEFLEDSIIYLWNKEDFLTEVSIVPELGMKAIIFLSSFLRSLNKEIQKVG